MIADNDKEFEQFRYFNRTTISSSTIKQFVLCTDYGKMDRGYSRLLATKLSNKMDSSFTCKLYVKFLENIINLKNFKMIDSVKNIKP